MMHRQGRKECRHGSNNNKIMTSGGCTGVYGSLGLVELGDCWGGLVFAKTNRLPI